MYHRCKTTTTGETILQDDMVIATREKLKKAVSSYSIEQTYQTLLQDQPHVRWDFASLSFSLPMKRSILGLYFVPVQIGSQHYEFVIDTGAQISSIKANIAQKHHASKLPGKLAVGSIGGKEKTMSGYLLSELKIGALTIHDLPVVSLPPTQLQLPFGKVDLTLFDGILGWDILSQLDFELDDVDQQLKVLHNRYRFPYPNMVKATFPLFLMKDGKGNLLTMGFDSGARFSWVNKNAMTNYAYRLSKENMMMGYGVHGLEEMKVQIVSDISLYLYKASIRLKNVYTGRTDIFAHMPLDGVVGNEIFRNRRIRIINSKEMVLIA